MISPSQIVRLINHADYRRLVERLLANGRCHSPVAIAALLEPEVVTTVAVGLGLQRVGELTYWAVPEGVELAHRLLRLQRRDGLFAPMIGQARSHSQIAATAIAMRGLIDWCTLVQHREDELALLQQSLERGFAALAREFGRTQHAISGHDRVDAATTAWAIVLWQLGDCELACDRLPLRDIRSQVAASDPSFCSDDLARLAFTMAA